MIDSLNESEFLLEELAQMGTKKVAVIIGRFQPPSKGHYEVVNAAKKFIRANPNLKLEAFPVIVVIGGSKSDDDKKRNPLTVAERISFMKGSGYVNGTIITSAQNAFSALAHLRNQNLEPIAIAAGSDRADDYIRILDKNFLTPNGKPIKHFKIDLSRDESAVLSKGEDKNNALDKTLSKLKSNNEIDTDLISGSLARRAVELGYEPEFAEIVGLTHKPILAKKMFDKIKIATKD